MVRGFPSHVDLTVSDISRSVAFYEQVLGRLGYRKLPEAGAGAPCWGSEDADGGLFTIALQPARASGPHDRYAPGLHHFAFHADSRADVDRFYRFLRETKITILDAPAEYDYTPGYYAVFFADPDGLKLEFVHEPELRGRLARHDQGAITRGRKGEEVRGPARAYGVRRGRSEGPA